MRDTLASLGNGLADLAGLAGRGVLGIGTLGMSEALRMATEAKEKQQQQSLARVGGILSGDEIPAFLRPGGTEAMAPEEFQAAKTRQLFALGTPEAAKIGLEFLETPATQFEKEKFKQALEIDKGNLAARRAEISQRNKLSLDEATARREENQLRRDEIAFQKDITRQERREQLIKRDTEKLSSRVEKSGATDLLTAFQNLKSLVPEKGDVAGYGATYGIPNFLLSDKGQEIRQNIATLRNTILKARSGGAVTPAEADRLLQELGEGYFKDDAALRRGIKNSEKTLKLALKNIYAGFDDDVIDEYASRGGITLDSFNAPNVSSPDMTPIPQGWSIREVK